MSRHDSPDTSRTDWVRLDAMTDEDIDYSDIPPLTDAFFERAIFTIPAAQAGNLIALDPDVIAWFRSQDTEYKALINSILRRFMEAQPP